MLSSAQFTFAMCATAYKITMGQ